MMDGPTKEELARLMDQAAEVGMLPMVLDAPITVHYEPATGVLQVVSQIPLLGSLRGVKQRAVLTQAATRELMHALRQLEETLGAPIADPERPTSIQ